METTVSLAQELNITAESVVNRAKNLGFFKESKFWKFTDEQADMIRDYKPIRSPKEKYHKRKIHILDFYLSNKNNSIELVSKAMDLPISRIETTINEWCENNHYIIVESKIN